MYLYQDTWVILLAQSLHAFSFGGIYLSSVKLTYRLLPDHLRDRGQGWLTAFGLGLGMLLGRIATTLGGESIDSFTELSILFLPATFVAILAFLISFGIKLPLVKPEKVEPATFPIAKK